MAGMDWFRWHHGSVTDPKFQLIARKTKSRVADVIAVWAFLLEAASKADDRGNTGQQDFEAIDCALGLDDGQAQAIHGAMVDRGVIVADGRIAAWEKRQPKREREDDKSTERVKAFREKKRQETQSNASETPCNATKRLEESREDKSREEINNSTADKSADPPPGFAKFWETWPTNDRKQAKGKCLEAWKKAHAERDAALVIEHVISLKNGSWTKDGGQFIPAPLTYLNGRRWEGAEAINSSMQNSIFAGAI